MSTDFEIDFFSDNKYEKITIEISYKGQILCQLNKDKGISKIEIEFFFDSRILVEQVTLKFPLDEFINILTEARQELVTA
ncbi:hypothetical protein J3U22_06140 [Gilliamella sp. B2865]|uniref:hypothetical protein n=1 Tax=unclassified Gilliamella TaxID=2685620 RepID=UPI00226A7CB6|nr:MULTISPECIES: hypothetical protein [unclassified Gilliamella]MCX8670902.1 hypothetical protein [Gilliamella sp. B2785]MCX8679183.1 hypothetical protein [Gilliamella sp. B2865]